MKGKWWVLIWILVLIPVLFLIYRPSLERAYNQFMFVDGFGRMYLDTFDYPELYGLIIDDENCGEDKETFLRLEFLTIKRNNYDVQSEKSQFFGLPHFWLEYVATAEREGRIFASFKSGNGRIEMDESCRNEINPSKIRLAYTTTRTIPIFETLVIPVLTLHGEFQAQVEILEGSVLKDFESIPLRTDRLRVFDSPLEHPADDDDLLSSWLAPYPNTINLDIEDGRSIDWDRAYGVIIYISGYGELTLGRPYFQQ